MSTERFQPHERKTWAVGGTGIVTACVRDMRRSDTLLEREEIDLAFEVCDVYIIMKYVCKVAGVIEGTVPGKTPSMNSP